MQDILYISTGKYHNMGINNINMIIIFNISEQFIKIHCSRMHSLLTSVESVSTEHSVYSPSSQYEQVELTALFMVDDQDANEAVQLSVVSLTLHSVGALQILRAKYLKQGCKLTIKFISIQCFEKYQYCILFDTTGKN